ncbi:MAG: HU family DNA-binding protein [Patescibacteria group bacterium]
MNKTELANAIAERVGLTKKQAEDMIEVFMDIATSELVKGNEVALSGFGAFSARLRKARAGVDPRHPTERIQIPDVWVPKFRAGRSLKEALKKKTSS